MAFLALSDKFLESNKELLDFDKYQKDTPTDNLAAAFDIAEKHLGIPKLLEPQDVVEGNVDERSLVLYISLYFHAFTAKQQQQVIENEKRQIEEKMRGLEGSLEQRAKLGAELAEENKRLLEEIEKLRIELNESKDKNVLLEERVTVLSQLLEKANQEKEVNETTNTTVTLELNKTKENLTNVTSDLEKEKEARNKLEELKLNLEEQIAALQGQVSSMTNKLDSESTDRKKFESESESRARTEIDGLGVLKRNLEEHVEDLYRWQKFLNLENEATVDFSGEIRPQIIADINKSNFNDQLKYLAKKLENENESLVQLLKQKETEAKAKKLQEEKKRERQKKNDN